MPADESRPTPLWMPRQSPTWRALASSVELPDDAIVVRGGTMRLEGLLKAAEKTEAILQRAGISVYAAEVPTKRDLLNQITMPQMQVRFSDVGRIREAGFELEQTFDPPHHTIWLPEDDDRTYWLGELERMFDMPVDRDSL